MYKSLKTKNHLTTCSANFSRLRKILCDFENDIYTFEILNNEQKNRAEFLIISRTNQSVKIFLESYSLDFIDILGEEKINGSLIILYLPGGILIFTCICTFVIHQMKYH